MRKALTLRLILGTVILILGAASYAHANQAARGWCELGGETVVTRQVNSTNSVQASYPSCIVTVHVHGGGLASIYADNNILPTPLSNPFTVSATGQWMFYAANGRYDITVGGAGYPSPVTYSNVPLFDCIVSSCSSAVLLTLNGTWTRTSLVNGAASFLGPRPWVDVTAYGADPTGAMDSTSAIIAAINAACSSKRSINFPSGVYVLTQPQLPSKSPVLPIPSTCSGLHFVGESGTSGGSQFVRQPSSELIVNTVGSNPNAAPVFGVGAGYGASSTWNQGTFENLAIVGHNQALNIYGEDGVTLRNVCLSLGGSATRQTDNTPLKVTDSIWFTWYGGCLQAPRGVPAVIWTGETLGSSPATVGLVDMEGIIISSGLGMQYIQRAPLNGGTPGNWHLLNVLLENATNDFLTISNTSGSPMTVSGITMDHVETADSPSQQNLINFNGASSNDSLSGIVMNQVQAGSGGAAIKVTRGTLGNYQTNACSSNCTWQVVDSSGNLVGGGQIQDYGGGQDFICSNPMTPPVLGNAAFLNDCVGARFFKAGNTLANIGIDAFGGVMFSSLASYGFSGGFTQSTPETTDLEFAKLLPPTNVTPTASLGGSIPNGTYYVFLSSTPDNCTTQSAASLAGGPVTLSGSYGAISVTWTLPGTTYSTPDGYCVGITATNNPNGARTQFVSRATATSFLATTTTGVNPMLTYNVFQPMHRFALNSLCVNCTNPTANLTVNGTASIGGGSTINKILQASGLSLNSAFASITAGTCQDRTLTVKGAATTGIASVSPTAALGTGFSWSAWVSAANTVSVHVCAGTTGTPNSVTWNAEVVQ